MSGFRNVLLQPPAGTYVTAAAVCFDTLLGLEGDTWESKKGHHEHSIQG